MNRKNLTLYIGVYLLHYLSLSVGGNCQSPADSSESAFATVKEIYFSTLGSELNLYNGVSYKGYILHETDEGQPYFASELWVEGFVNYDGVLYEDVSMLYDLVEDKVIIDHKFGAGKLELITEKLSSFGLNKHYFVHLNASMTSNTPENGFYERLFDGRLKAYAKWHKKKIDVVGAAAVQVKYEDQNRFYIFNGNEYVQVKSKSSVLNVLKDKKQVLSKFIRKYKLKFGATCGESLPKVLALYESGS
jgi:hypothetical protein